MATNIQTKIRLTKIFLGTGRPRRAAESFFLNKNLSEWKEIQANLFIEVKGV